MKSHRIAVIGLMLAFSIVSCGGKRVNIEAAQIDKNDYVSVDVGFLKDKGKKYDVELSITNTSKKDIIFLLRNMDCFKGEVQGTLKHTFFNTGEKTIDFKQGQTKKFKMVCDIGSNAPGDYKIVIRDIYDNPNHDGATKGDILKDKVELKLVGKN